MKIRLFLLRLKGERKRARFKVYRRLLSAKVEIRMVAARQAVLQPFFTHHPCRPNYLFYLYIIYLPSKFRCPRRRAEITVARGEC